MNLSVNQEKTIIDPVCGMAVTPKMTEIKADIDGDTYYFCAEGCRKLFIDDPEQFLNPKPAKKKSLWCRYLERLEKASGGKAMKCH